MSKTPLDHALDLLVFAPLGLAFTARDALPELIDKGRDHITGHVSSARMMGHLAVSQGHREAERAVAQAADRLAGLGLIPAKRRSSPGDAEPATPSGAPAPSDPAVAGPDLDTGSEPAAPSPAPSGTVASADDLAIPGYDSLSAPQVVQRLAGLATEELDAVRSYESATRHRKTILTRISQLQDPTRP